MIVLNRTFAAYWKLGMLMKLSDITRFAFLLSTGALCVATAYPQASRTLRADLGLIAQCQGRPTVDTEGTVEQFLKAEGFKSLNLGRIQKDHGVGIYDLHAIGLQGKDKILDILAVPREKGRYAVGLYTRPPTVHSVPLEKSIEDFFANRLQCRITQMNRGDNPVEAMDFFNREIARIEGLFQQADALDGRRPK